MNNNMFNGFSKNELYKLMFSRPSFAQIELTRNCNQDCPFCFSRCGTGTVFKDLSLDNWKIIIDKVRELGVRTIHLSGGEVTLYPWIAPLLKYIKSLNLRVHLNTNGQISLRNIGLFLDEVVFSVHGTEDIHNEIVGKNNSFQSVLNNIEYCNEMHIPVALNIVIIKKNRNILRDIYEYFEKSYQISSYSFTYAAKSNNGSDFEDCFVELTEEELKQHFLFLDSIERHRLILKHSLSALYRFEYKGDNELLMPICAGGKDKLVIKYDGSVYPCSFFQNSDYYCGNILTEDPIDIWRDGKGFIKFRDLIYDERIPKKCLSCKKMQKCFGGCRIWTKKYLENGGIYDDSDRRCEILHSSC